MVFQLSTFGALELRTAGGGAVPGAAGQPKPLLILALAALTPGGIPRDRLLHALWPGVNRERARATLKQHLYALRRATGEPELVHGSPRLRINRDVLRVDALDFAEHVERGRLREASALVRGELFEGLSHDPAVRPELAELIGEIRRDFAPRIALVREADAARRVTTTIDCVDLPPAVRGAERELAAAARRFGQAMAALPSDRGAAFHRAVSISHDLLEALRDAERADVPPARIADLIGVARELWLRSELVRRMQAAGPGESLDVEAMEWLVDGGARTADATGRALERHLLESPFTAQLRQRLEWQARQIVATALAVPEANVLLIAPAGEGVAPALPALVHTRAAVVLNAADPDALALTALRLAGVEHRLRVVEGDCFRRIAELEAEGPFQLIAVGTLFDGLHSRAGGWLVPRLLRMLAPDGRICLTSLAAEHPFGPWLRHIVGWELVERDQEDVILLLGESADRYDIVWDNDPRELIWRLTLRRRLQEPHRVTRAAA